MSTDNLDFPSFVKQVLEALEVAGVNYMIGGALALWAWGEPRMTLDLDLVVSIPIESIPALSKELKQRNMLVPEEIILDTLVENRADLAINALHGFSGLKAELFPVREGDELRQVAFERRRLAFLGPDIGEAWVHSPEDLILYKLWYYSLSQQSKHVRDILSILKAQRTKLDLQYIQYWVDQRHLETIWGEIQSYADSI